MESTDNPALIWQRLVAEWNKADAEYCGLRSYAHDHGLSENHPPLVAMRSRLSALKEEMNTLISMGRAARLDTSAEMIVAELVPAPDMQTIAKNSQPASDNPPSSGIVRRSKLTSH